MTSYGYDAVSRLGSLGHDLAGTANDVATTFAYNPAGQIVTRSVSNDAYAWPGSAAATTAYTANGLNQYSTVGAVTPSYDARGNMTNAGGPTFQYNSRGELYAAGAGTLYYRGPTGLLGQAMSGGVTTNFDNVDGELATERDATTGQVQRRYVFGPGVDEPLVWYEGAGTSDRRWLAADERGSVVAVTGATGAALAVNRYDDYGQPGSGNLGRFQYTGQKWFPELGLYDYKARMYDPNPARGGGRFPQTDPIGYAGGSRNVYGYVNGDPVNLVDPSGLRLVWACVGDGAGHDHCGWVDDRTGSRTDITLSSPGVGRSPSDTGTAEGSQNEDIIVTAKKGLKKFGQCFAVQYGFGDGTVSAGIDLGKIASEISAVPLYKPWLGVPVIGESSRFTNVLSYVPFRLGIRLNTGVQILGSGRVFGILGRLNGPIGATLFAYDAVSISICLARR